MLLLFVLTITGCATSQPSPGPKYTSPEMIAGRTWGWEKSVTPVELFDVTAPERYTVHVAMDGKIHIKFDCNIGNVDYKITDGTIQVTRSDFTKKECPAGNRELASHFIKQLEQVTNYYVQDSKLHLEKSDGALTMLFKELKP